jgi:hypothetical protein
MSKFVLAEATEALDDNEEFTDEEEEEVWAGEQSALLY